MTDQDDPLPPFLDTLLRSYPQAVDPPASFEERIFGELRRRNQHRRLRFRIVLGAAAALILAALGFLIGRTWPQAAGAQADYAIFIREDAFPATDEASRVQEYSEWARRLRQQGHMIIGEKLSDTRQIVMADRREIRISPSSTRGDVVIGGLFLISAPSDDDAMRIARSCPHLRHGGSVELRRVEH